MNLNTTLMFEDGADSDDENEVFVQNEVADNT
jgi:hypothetical protein